MQAGDGVPAQQAENQTRPIKFSGPVHLPGDRSQGRENFALCPADPSDLNWFHLSHEPSIS